MQEQQIVTRTGTHYLDADGIIRATIHPGAEQTLEDAIENVRVSAQLGAGKRRPLLVDMREVKSQTREARTYYTGPEGTRCYCAAAVLVDSPVSRLIANFLLGFNKSATVPSRLFTSESEAIAWLKTFLD